MKKSSVAKKEAKNTFKKVAVKPNNKETKKPVKKAITKSTKTCKTTKGSSKAKKQITKNMLLGDIMEMKPDSGEVFLGFGLHCFGCPMAAMETLEEVAELYEINLELMLKKLNEL